MEMTYLTDSIFDYTTRNDENYILYDYHSMDLIKINEYIDQLDDNMFDWIQIQNNVTLEKIALDFYGNADYWDLILIINNTKPLFEMPYDFDALSNMVEDKISSYISEVYGNNLPTAVYNIMYEKYQNEMIINNEYYRIIRIIRPSMISQFFQQGYEMGYFK